MRARAWWFVVVLSLFLARSLSAQAQACAHAGNSNTLSGRGEVTLVNSPGDPGAGTQPYPNPSQIAEGGNFWNNSCDLMSGISYPEFRFAQSPEPGSIRVEFHPGRKDELNPACNCYPVAEWDASRALIVVYGEFTVPGVPTFLIPTNIERDGTNIIAHELGHALGIDNYSDACREGSNSIMAGTSGFRVATEADCDVANQQNQAPAEWGPIDPFVPEYQDVCMSFFEYCGSFDDPWWTGNPGSGWTCTDRWETVTTCTDLNGDGVQECETTNVFVSSCGPKALGGPATYYGPTVSLREPNPGSTLRGKARISGWAVDRDGVGTVAAWLDGTKVELSDLRRGEPVTGACQTLGGEAPLCDTASGFSALIDVSSVPPGQHMLQVLAIDRIAETPVITDYQQPVVVAACAGVTPSVGMNSPAAGAVLSGNALVTATASGESSILKVELQVDGVVVATDSREPFILDWNTRTWAEGSHLLRIRAEDGCGNVGLSPQRQVTVRNDTTPPQVSLTAPSAGAVVGGITRLVALASDANGIAWVQFYADGVLLGTDTTAPYSFDWNTASVADGSHSLLAVAFDTPGNPSTSAAVTVTVNNARSAIRIMQDWDGAAVSKNSTIVFPSTPVNVTVSRRFRIHNDGNASLTLTSPAGLVNGTCFSQIETPTTPVAPGAVAYFRVRLLCSSAGTYTGTVSIASNDPDDNPYSFSVQGSVTVPQISAIRVAQDWDGAVVPKGSTNVFPSTPANVTVSRRFRIHNDGNASLTLTSPASLVSGTCFSQIETPATPIAPGAVAYFRVRLLCSSAGTYTGTVSIASNDPDDNPYSFSVQGSVTMPQTSAIRVVQDWDGAVVPKGSTNVFPSTPANVTVSRRFRIHNDGNASLTLTSPASLVSGTCFSQIETPATPIAPGAVAYFRVRLLCSSAGTYTGTVSITSNDPDDNPYSFSVQGSVTTPQISAIRVAQDWNGAVVSKGSTVVFPSTPVNVAISRRFRIHNDGNASLTLTSPAGLVSGTCYSQIETPAIPVAPGTVAYFRVRLLCSSAGTYTGTVSIASNDPDDNPYTFYISGSVN